MAATAVFGEGGDYLRGEHVLRADLEVNPAELYSCPIADVSDEVEEIRYNAMDGQCRVDLLLADGRVVRATDRLEAKRCFCAIFQSLDCVPQYEGIENGVVHVSTYLSDQSAIRALIRELRGFTDTVRLTRLTAIGDDAGTRTVLFDLSVLTDKQREALELAVARGYYADEDVDLCSLAAELDITTAAFSQRLRRAQANLASELVG